MFFALSDYRFPNSCISAKYCPFLTKPYIKILKLTLMTGFTVQSHINALIIQDVVLFSTYVMMTVFAQGVKKACGELRMVQVEQCVLMVCLVV